MADPLQSSALNALAPFIALAPSASSPRAASDLISQATSAPNTYVFAELLQTANIQALRNAEEQYSCWLKVLEIFAWGTWNDYEATQGLPSLNNQQTQKLKLLTILTLARTPTALTYPALQSALNIPSTFDLELLLTNAIYAGLISAKLNPLKQRVDIASVAPLRDLAPDSAPELSRILGLWEARCGDVLKEVEERIEAVKKTARERGRAEREWEENFENAVGEDKDGKEGLVRGVGKREGDFKDEEGRKSGRVIGRGGRALGLREMAT